MITKNQTKNRTSLKRLFLSLMTCFMFLMGMWTTGAQAQTVTIGTGTSTVSTVPIYSCYGYSYSQILYLGSEITTGGWGGGAGTINKIRFYYATAAATPGNYNNWTVYLGNTTATTLTAGPANYTPTSSMTQCFSGTVTFPAAGNWMEITLSTPFSYTGNNLIVAVDENATGYSCSATWRYTTTSGTMTRYLYSDTYNPNPAALPGSYSGSSSSTTSRPNIQLDMVGAPCSGTPTPGNTVSNTNPVCTGVNFNLSLQNLTSGSGVTYQWQSADDAAFTIGVTNLGTSTTQTTSQTSAKYYRCNVTCTNSGQSAYSNPLQVTMNSDFCQCAAYCASAFTSVTYEFITNVTFAGINNTSTGTVGGPVNYTNLSGSVTIGQPSTLSVTIDPDANEYVYAWIDWDQNGTFGNNANEVYTLATSTSIAGPHTLSITPPVGATLGSTRMRVMIDWDNATPNPCRSATYGEAEDYCITVNPPPPCSGTPSGGTSAASANPVCQYNPTTLSLTGHSTGMGGLSYQWKTSATPGGPYTDISGATTTSYVYTPSASGTEYIVCEVSCSFSSLSALSTETTLVVNPGPSGTATGPGTLLTYQNGTFTVTGYPLGTTFQWQASTTNCAAGFSDIVSATSDNVLLNSNAAGTFYIRCMMTNAGCSAPSNCITLVVSVAGDNVCSANTLNVGVNGPYTNVGATLETGEVAPPSASCTAQTGWCSTTLNNTVWFTFTPPASGQYSFGLDPARNRWDTQFALWNASACSPFAGFTLIAANDDSASSPFNSYIQPLCLNAGQTYYFQFDGYSTTNNNWGILVTQVNTVTAGISGSQTGCSAVNLTATGGSTYLWSGGSTPSTAANTFTASGPYTVTVTSAQGCTSQATANVVINVPSTDPGSATSNASFDAICAGGNVTLTVGGGTLGTGADWQWYSGSCGGTPVGSGGSITVSPAATTTYFVRAEGVCGNTMCVFITITVSNGIPAQSVVIPITGLPNYACNGTTAAVSIPAVANATQYTWDGPTGTTFDGQPSPYVSTMPSVNIVFGNPNGSGYRIGVQAGNGCGSSLRKSQWVRSIVSTPAAVSGATTTCASSSGTYTTNSSEGATSYLWTISGDATVIGTDTNVTVNFGPSWTGGTLCVRAQTPCYTSPAKCLVIGTSAAPLNTISGPLSACPNDVLTFSVPASSGAASYAWTVPANSSITGGLGTNSIQVTFAPGYNNLGNICVNVTSICGVTSANKCRTVAPGVPSVPASITGATNGLCGQSISYSTPFKPGTTYNWTAPGTITGNGSNAVSIAYGSFTSGQVCVTASTGCGTSAARCIAIKGQPNSPVALTAIPASWCANTSGVEFTANVSNTAGSYTLSWTYPSAPVATYTAGGGNTTSLILDWGTGNGTVIVSATNSCGTGSKAFVATIGCKEGEMASANKLNVYPNPTAGVLNIEYTAEKGNAQVTVLDLSGRVVMTQTHANVSGQNNLQLDLSKVAKGAYMLNVQTEGSNNQVRVVVE